MTENYQDPSEPKRVDTKVETEQVEQPQETGVEVRTTEVVEKTVVEGDDSSESQG